MIFDIVSIFDFSTPIGFLFLVLLILMALGVILFVAIFLIERHKSHQMQDLYGIVPKPDKRNK